MTMPRILCVDDEARVLSGLENILGWDFEIETTTSPPNALERLAQAQREGNPFALIISDMRMPGMDGAQLLSEVRQHFPEVTRVLLTGYTDIDSAMKAVNEGAIFRLMLKPCPPDVLKQVATEAVEQNRLLTAERVLLDQTLQGAIEALVDTLSLASPIAFSRATTIRDYVRHMAKKLDLTRTWACETAALFAHMGLVAVPSSVIERFVAQQPLNEQESEMVMQSSEVAARLLEHVPRLESVTDILRGLRAESLPDEPETALAIQMVRVAIDADLMVMRGESLAGSMKSLAKRHPAPIVDLLAGFEGQASEDAVRSVSIEMLDTSMVFEADVLLQNGQLLIKKGQRITPALVARLENFDRSAGVKQPLLVKVAS